MKKVTIYFSKAKKPFGEPVGEPVGKPFGEPD
jgi:hypothetical protein